MDLHLVDRIAPVNLYNSLNRDLVFWWYPLPGLEGGASAIDIMGGHHGALTGDGVTWSSMSHNQVPALAFGASDDYVLIPPSMLASLSGREATVMLWHRPTTTGGGMKLFGGQVSTDSTRQLNMYIDSTTSGFNAAAGDLGGTWSSGTPLIVVNEWQHFTFIAQGGAGIRLFRDGLFVDQATSGTPVGSAFVATAWHLGDDGTAANADYAGKISDVRVLDRGLTDEEVYDSYLQSLAYYPGLLNRRAITHFVPVAGAELDISAALSNAAQALAATTTVEIDVSVALANAAQTLASTLEREADISSALANAAQVLAGAMEVEIDVSTALVNSAQVIASTIAREADVSGSLANAASVLAANLTLEASLSSALTNAAQTLGASVTVEAAISAAITNAAQTIAATVVQEAAISAGLSNAAVLLSATLTNERSLSSTLLNATQVLAGTLDTEAVARFLNTSSQAFAGASGGTRFNRRGATGFTIEKGGSTFKDTDA